MNLEDSVGGAPLVRLGNLLRDARVSRSITGVRLASIAHLSQSRISKIETGKYGLPDRRDLESIVESLGVFGEESARIWRQYEIAQLSPTSYLSTGSDGLASKQGQIATLEQSSALIRVYQIAVIPGLLQTYDYSRELFLALGHDAESATRGADARLRRQAALRAPGKRFVFAFHESTLYSPPGSLRRSEHRIQLDFLKSQTYLENVRLGILQARKPYPLAVGNPFCIFDRRYVSAETTIEELVSTRDIEIREYEAAFEEIEQSATSNEGSREVIAQALVAFAPEG